MTDSATVHESSTYDDSRTDTSAQEENLQIPVDESIQNDPRLFELLDAWNELPEPVRVGIYAMVTATKL